MAKKDLNINVTDTTPAIPPDEAARLSVLQQDIPFIQACRLLQGASPAVANNAGRPGEFILGNYNFGTSFRASVVDWMWQAIQLKEKKVVKSSNVCEVQIVEVQDEFEPGKTRKETHIIGDAIFKEIANTEDDQKAQLVNLWGIKLLLAIPDHAIWGSLFLSRKTSRKHAMEFLSPTCFRRPCKVYSEKAPPWMGFTWYEPHCSPLTESELDDFYMPPEDSWKPMIEKFKTAPKVQDTDEEER